MRKVAFSLALIGVLMLVLTAYEPIDANGNGKHRYSGLSVRAIFKR